MDDFAPDAVDDTEEAQPPKLSTLEKLLALANAEGDFSHALSKEALKKLADEVVDDYDRDKTDPDRVEWEEKVTAAISSAAQEKPADKDTPWPNASNVKYPLLTTASLQFNARAYPAIVKGDEVVSIKVIGRDVGRPQMGPQGPLMQPGSDGQPQPVWAVQPGAKARRASRVKEYMNVHMLYRTTGWEADTDSLTLRLPTEGCMFRKAWYADGECHTRLVSGLKIIAPMKARDCESAPRLTEEIDDLFTYEVNERIASGFYRDVVLEPEGEDKEAPRLLLEQHRRMDMDEDGVSEPYIITVDYKTREILRIESNFGREQAMKSGGSVKKLSTYYIKYDFFPNPKGGFYGIGFGHLLEQISAVIDTKINQLNDADTAAIAGGGFVASGVRLQGRGGNALAYEPGKYKTVNGATGAQLREAIFERTLPNASPVGFQLLDLMLSAARDITSVKDVVTGEASNNGQVGTTLALIDQSLQMFTAIYKRIYRALKEEFEMIREAMARWGGEAMAQDYMEVLDDPEADFARDFNIRDMDIRPVSDPKSVTRMQKMASGQFLLSTMEPMMAVGGDGREIMRRVYEAADIEDIDKLLPQPQPKEPSPAEMAKVDKDKSAAALNMAKVEQAQVGTQLEVGRANLEAFKVGMDAGSQPEQVAQS